MPVAVLIATLMMTGFLCFVLGAIFGEGNSDTVELRQQAIEHGVAQYNPKTGEWEWLPRND